MSKISIKNAVKKYGENTVIPNLSAEIGDGELFTLLGPSGCGKTTLLRMIAGFNSIEGGDIFFNDTRINDMDPSKRNIGMVFQNYALYPHMTIYDNMAFGLKLRKTPKAEIDRRVKEAAKILDIEHLLTRKPKALSGGQRQRVALGRAIVREPKVFLMDEPLSNLDAKLRVQMRTEITKLHHRLQTTFIYVTHDQTEALTMGTRIVVMKDGFIQQVDTPQNVFDYPSNLFVAGFIGSPQMNFFDVKLERRGNDVYAVFGQNEVKVPEGKIKKLTDPSYVGKTVKMGIRPENLHDEELFLQNSPDSIIDADVEVVELMGSETYLYLKTVDTGISFIARVDARSTSRAGDKIKIALDANRLHFFDVDTEATILNR